MTRTITTAAELDALHDERVLLEASGSYRYGSGTFEECWVRPVPPWITGTPERVWEVLVHGGKAPLSLVHTEDLDLPVTVLVDPSAPSEAADTVATPPAMRIEGTWLVEVVDEHTCGAGPGSGTGMHEPGCGLVPVVDLATLPGWDERLTAAPASAPSVVPVAAVEAAASAVRKERAFSAAAAFGVPMDDVPQCAEMIARTALTAALPFLTAAPSVTRDEVYATALAASHVTITDSPYQKAEWLGIADALLARFNITPKEDR